VFTIIKLKEAIIVEGIYDKIKLQQIVDATIITTDGFSIFSDKEKMQLIRTLAKKKGIVVLTDSDRAGFLIRSYLKESVDPQYVKHAYIPEIKGVEKRKVTPGKEGLLGVEGLKDAVIIDALKRSGCTLDTDGPAQGKRITKTDLYLDGLHGKPNSRDMRNKLKRLLHLPTRISANSLLDVLNTLYTYEEYKKLMEALEENHPEDTGAQG
jgi:ribonuclease M5